jgi:hypothetical protein
VCTNYWLATGDRDDLARNLGPLGVSDWHNPDLYKLIAPGHDMWPRYQGPVVHLDEDRKRTLATACFQSSEMLSHTSYSRT